MQQVLALKDQQLAILQGQAKAQAVAPTPSTQTPLAQKPPVQASAPVPATPAAQPATPAVSEDVDYFLLGGGASAVVLGLLAFLWWRKRTQARSGMYADDFEDIPDFFASAIENNVAKGSDTIGASSFFSDFTFGDFDTFDTDQGEIDPVSEADVYLAYGRYQQAEELMRDVIKGQPNRDDFKLKLLEIFYTNENKPSFEAYAQQLADAGKKEDFDFWSKVTEMGSEICPGSTLFNTEIDRFYPSHKVSLDKIDKEEITQPKVKPETEDDIIIAEGNVIESKTTETEETEDADYGRKTLNTTPLERSTNPTNHFLGIDLSSFEEGFDGSKNNESIDFDLNSDLPDELLESFFTRPQDSPATDEFESFEFDFSIGDNDNNLSALDQNQQKQNELLSIENPNATTSNFANDVLAGNYRFENKATGTERHYFDNHTGLEIFDLTDMDELETKLDLAIAYRDIRDNDAFKVIVNEVIKKGTTEQKKLAQALLNDLQ
ncbi:MAG: hypothetical protein HOP21_12275 [Methylotenera sp.]|nr:hypothetical protein [Methylotenera sp.]